MKRGERLKNVIIYCRESRDDGFVNFERIETQRDILIDFCNKKQLGKIIDVVMDDNLSGTNFERLNPVKARILNGEIDVFLCKDASRIGRNLLDSLKFIEFLDENNIELIFESETYSEDMFPIVAWFNERRAKDDSLKIRRVLKHKMHTGSMVIKAPYGYIKEANQLKVDQNQAIVVKEIFYLFANGVGFQEIATILNKKGYKTPSQVKGQYENTNRTDIWNRQHIERILGHIAYSGDMAYGMREKISYKSNKYRTKDKKDWIIIKDHHEPIIDRETFIKVQKMLENRDKTKRERIEPNANLFSGMVYCGRCSSKLYSKKIRSGKRVLICNKNNIEGRIKEDIKQGYGCTTHRIYEDDLLEYIKNYINDLFNDRGHKDIILNAYDRVISENKTDKNEIKSKEKLIEALKQKASKVYDDKLESKLPDFLFNQKMKEILSELEQAELQLEKLNGLDNNYSGKTKNIEDIIKMVLEKGITNNTISFLIKKIIVFDEYDISEEKSDKYGLNKKQADDIYLSGGVIFVKNYNV